MLKAHQGLHVRYMRKGTELLQKFCDKMHTENKVVVIPVEMCWLGNTDSSRHWRYRRELSAMTVMLVGKGNNVAHYFDNDGMKVVGVGQYQVEPVKSVHPDSGCKHCCG